MKLSNFIKTSSLINPENIEGLRLELRSFPKVVDGVKVGGYKFLIPNMVDDYAEPISAKAIGYETTEGFYTGYILTDQDLLLSKRYIEIAGVYEDISYRMVIPALSEDLKEGLDYIGLGNYGDEFGKEVPADYRHMEFTINDKAYVCTNEMLNESIELMAVYENYVDGFINIVELTNFVRNYMYQKTAI